MSDRTEYNSDLKRALDDFNHDVKVVRESLAYAAPELHDFHWRRIEHAGKELAALVIAAVLDDKAREADEA